MLSEVIKVARFKDRVTVVVRQGEWKDSRRMDPGLDPLAFANESWPNLFNRPHLPVTVEVAGEIVHVIPAASRPLRAVRVTYANGNVIETNMAASVTDEMIRDYYRVGSTFNIGFGEEDNLQQVASVEILS